MQEGPLDHDVFMNATANVVDRLVTAEAESEPPGLATFKWMSQLACSHKACSTKVVTAGVPPATISSLLHLEGAQTQLVDAINAKWDGMAMVMWSALEEEANDCKLQQLAVMSRCAASERTRLQLGTAQDRSSKHLQTILGDGGFKGDSLRSENIYMKSASGHQTRFP